MRAGAVVVPLDLRMAKDVLQRIAQSAGAQWLAIGTGLDAPDPRRGRPGASQHQDRRVARRPAVSTRTRPARTRVATTLISLPTGSSRSTAGRKPTREQPLRGHLHERHDRRAQGRDAPARHGPRDARGHRQDPASTGASGGQPAAAEPPVRAGARAHVRHDDRRAHPVRPQSDATRHLRRAARGTRHDHGPRPAAARAFLAGAGARGQAAGSGENVQPRRARSPATSPTGRAAASSVASTSSSAASST